MSRKSAKLNKNNFGHEHLQVSEVTQTATFNRSSNAKGSPVYNSTRWEDNMAKIAEKERELEMLKSEMNAKRWNTSKLSPT